MMYSKLVKPAIAVFLLMFSLQCSTLGEGIESDASKKNDDSKVVQEAVKKDSELIKQMMAQGQHRTPDPEFKNVEFGIGNNKIEGSPSAKLIMVQFSDYTCSHCAIFTEETYPKILKNYVDTGKLRYVIVDYPLPGNTIAVRAAEAVHCASDQGKLREMHEVIMSQQESLDDLDSLFGL